MVFTQFRLVLAVVLEAIQTVLTGEYFFDDRTYWGQLWSSLAKMPKMLSSTSEVDSKTSPPPVSCSYLSLPSTCELMKS